MVGDMFATKGMEYLLVITFLLAWVAFWRMLRRSTAVAAPAIEGGVASAPWFSVPSDRLYHRGHTWVERTDGDVFRVGLDDFAQKLVGVPRGLALPAMGDRLVQGERGVGLEIDDRTVDVLSPVTGQVVAVNPAAASNPRLINDDPYESGWLFDVRLDRPRAVLSNLLPGTLAVEWMERSARALRDRMQNPELGVVLADGGRPVVGIARDLSADRWDEIAREFLLTGGDLAHSLPE